ncbi:MAG: gluconate:H+ symporter [Flavitalea sp.]
MVIVIALLSILLLVLLISYFKVHSFLSFLIVSIATGIALGLGPEKLFHALQEGIGSTLSSIVAIITLGAMLGKLVSESGAAERISETMIHLFGSSRIRWAFMITGFLVSLPLFFSVAFMLLVPLVISAARRTNTSAVYIGLPLLASLSVTQGFLPPHPAPLFLVQQLHADMGLTLFYGIIIAIPSILISGLLFGSTLKKFAAATKDSFMPVKTGDYPMPGRAVSFIAILLPIILIGGGAIITPMLGKNNPWFPLFNFIKEPVASLLISVIVAAYLLCIREGKPVKEVTISLTNSVKDVAGLILIFGGAGALKQIMIDGGLSDSLGNLMLHSNLSPLIWGWAMAAAIRISVGSSTVAGITTAALALPLMNGVNPNLMVLSIGAGSMTFSHVNDTGFWLFREYFQVSMRDTFRTWTVMESLVSVTGLLGVLILDWFI